MKMSEYVIPTFQMCTYAAGKKKEEKGKKKIPAQKNQ